MISRDWPAPAKLNLFLHVLGKRDDGYHDIQTAMQLLDYGDSMDFHLRDDGRIRLTGDGKGLPKQDLCVHAAALLQASSGCRDGVDIELHKRLPIGSGLGGGSSDAATCLVALNHLWQLGMDTDRLAGLGLCLGADVPFFVRGTSGIAEGMGELISPMPLEKCHFLVAWPKLHVSTGQVYQRLGLTHGGTPSKIASWPAPMALRNDLSDITCEIHPEARELLACMRGLEGEALGKASMSGSGGAMFLAFGDNERASSALAKLPEKWQGLVAAAADESPLLARLRQESRQA